MPTNTLRKIIRPRRSIVTRLASPGINKGREKGPQSQSTAGERSLPTAHHLNFLCLPTYRHTLISCFLSFHTPTLCMPTNCFLRLLPRIYDPSFIFCPKPEASATTSPGSSIICDSSARMKPQVGQRSSGMDIFPKFTITGRTWTLLVVMSSLKAFPKPGDAESQARTHSLFQRPVRKSPDSEEQKMKVGKPLKEPMGWSPTNLGSNPSPITPYWVTQDNQVILSEPQLPHL